MYFATIRRKQVSGDTHRKIARRYTRKARKVVSEGGVWRLDVGEILGHHIHMIIQSDEKPTKKHFISDKDAKRWDVKIQRIGDREVRNVAAYMIKKAVGKETETLPTKKEKPEPKPPTPPTGKRMPKNMAFFGNWRAVKMPDKAPPPPPPYCDHYADTLGKWWETEWGQ